jgi:S-adenosylmethionine:diacylglycerol 3-amino-3-carboxypropyl transferase
VIAVEKALEVIENWPCLKFSQYCQIYPSTTEQISEYFNMFDFKNKKVLTVASSGDHLLNAIYMGAEEIDTFDINELCGYYMYLKIASLRALSYNDFCKYFIVDFDNLSKLLNKEVYQKINQHFDNSEIEQLSKQFWDNLYSRCNDKNLRMYKLFRDFNEKEIIMSRNIYLAEKNKSYNLLRKKISNASISYANCDVKDLLSKFNKKYDLIILSNITDYLESTFNDQHIYRLKNLILSELPQILNPHGQIIMYTYGNYRNYLERSEFSHSGIDYVDDLLKFITINKIGNEPDRFMVYTKK